MLRSNCPPGCNIRSQLKNYTMNKCTVHVRLLMVLGLWAVAATISRGQPEVQWERTFGGAYYEELHAILPTSDGGYLLGGFTSSPQGFDVGLPDKGNGWGDIWIVKVDLFGNKIWEQRIGGDHDDRLYDMEETLDGGYILAGNSKSNSGHDKTQNNRGDFDYWIVKVDANGNKLWDKTYGGDLEDDLRGGIIPTADGGYVMAGFSASGAFGEKTQASKGNRDFWVVKIDGFGNKLWDKTYGGDQKEEPHAIYQTPDGGFLIGGLSESGISGDKTDRNRGSSDYWLIKIDPDGTLLWDKTYGGDGAETIHDIERTVEGNYLLGGQSSSYASFERRTNTFGGYDYWLVKIDPDGNLLWEKAYGGADLDVMNTVNVNRSNLILVGGVSRSDKSGNRDFDTYGDYDYWIIYLDEFGNKIWEKNVGGNDQDALTTVVEAHDGGYILGGHSRTSRNHDKSQPTRGENDMWIVKTKCVLSLGIRRDTVICRDESMTISAVADTCNGCEFIWSDGSTEPRRLIRPLEPTNYAVTITDNNGCSLEDSLFVDVKDKPLSLNFEVDSLDCSGDNDGAIRITGVNGGNPPYLYSFNKDRFLPYSTFESLSAGNYSIGVRDKYGCYLGSNIVIPDPEEFYITLGQDTSLFLGQSLTVTALANRPIARYRWNSTELLGCSDCLTALIQPTLTSTISIVAADEHGCEAEANLQILVRRDRQVYFPNAFSPNGDGANDFFMIYGGEDVVEVKYLRVFNRWGQLLYEIENFQPNQDPIGWDGQFKGLPIQTGTYTFTAAVEFFDGETEVFNGQVSLMR